MTKLRAKHNETGDDDSIFYGVDGITGEIVNMQVGETPVWEPIAVKVITILRSVSVIISLARIVSLIYFFKCI